LLLKILQVLARWTISLLLRVSKRESFESKSEGYEIDMPLGTQSVLSVLHRLLHYLFLAGVEIARLWFRGKKFSQAPAAFQPTTTQKHPPPPPPSSSTSNYCDGSMTVAHHALAEVCL
jgi:hypothetical protein